MLELFFLPIENVENSKKKALEGERFMYDGMDGREVCGVSANFGYSKNLKLTPTFVKQCKSWVNYFAGSIYIVKI